VKNYVHVLKHELWHRLITYLRDDSFCLLSYKNTLKEGLGRKGGQDEGLATLQRREERGEERRGESRGERRAREKRTRE